MAQAKSKYNPESGVLGGQDFEDKTVDRFNANRTMQSGTARPEDIQPDEVWQKILADGTREFYLWREGDTGDGTLLLMMSATDEQLSTASQAQLEKLGINAFQFKNLMTQGEVVKTSVDYATEHGQIGEIKIITAKSDILSFQEPGVYFFSTLNQGHTNVPDGWENDSLILETYTDGATGYKSLYNRTKQQLATTVTSGSISAHVWKIISDGSQGIPSNRKIDNIPLYTATSYSEAAAAGKLYTAPANGVVSTVINSTSKVRVIASGANALAPAVIVEPNYAQNLWVPIKKGTKVYINASPDSVTLSLSTFIYFEGN